MSSLPTTFGGSRGRKRSKIELSVNVTTHDGVRIILKPVAVGEQRLQTRLRAELRHKIRSILIEEAKLRTSPEFVREMLAGDLSKVLAHGLKTLYPLKKIEIRRSEVLGTIVGRGPGARNPAPRGRRGARPRRSPRRATAGQRRPGGRGMARPVPVGVAQPG